MPRKQPMALWIKHDVGESDPQPASQLWSLLGDVCWFIRYRQVQTVHHAIQTYGRCHPRNSRNSTSTKCCIETNSMKGLKNEISKEAGLYNIRSVCQLQSVCLYFVVQLPGRISNIVWHSEFGVGRTLSCSKAFSSGCPKKNVEGSWGWKVADCLRKGEIAFPS